MQTLLRHMRDEGVTHVVMEVSSHALELGRVRGIGFDVAGFTNLSQDHLDFHPTMRDYFDAKSKLFVEEQDGQVPTAVVCVDDQWGRELAAHLRSLGKAPVVTVSTDPAAEEDATWSVAKVDVTSAGRQIISMAGDQPSYSIGLAGSFNVPNSALALACVKAAGEDVSQAAVAIADVQVPGRMQAIDEGQDFLAVVDYAHKPGAVAAVVHTLADYLPSPEGRIGIVLGAGGNRDHSKRPKMGFEAAKVADAVFVTDDNPRDEEPAEIRRAVMDGVRDAATQRDGSVEAFEYGDRARAIAEAVAWARSGDAIVIAGKGHETGQEVRGVMHDFDDAAVLAHALREKLGADGSVK